VSIYTARFIRDF